MSLLTQERKTTSRPAICCYGLQIYEGRLIILRFVPRRGVGAIADGFGQWIRGGMPWWIFAAFIALLAGLIIIDLKVLHRNAHAISIRAALGWTVFWISLAMLFNGLVYLIYSGSILPGFLDTGETTGGKAALDFLVAYVIEYSLSIDNIFVIAMIIANFRVPAEFQHRLLFWGILGAAVLRGLMIFGGAALVHAFEPVMIFFGILLIYSAIKMLITRHDNIDPEANPLVRLVRKFYPVTIKFDREKFFTMENGRTAATPMLMALVLIESSDVMFAIDSIPAAFSVSRDPFIVFTSNIFAVLGLRSLYFALAGLMHQLRYMTISLVFLLIFIGAKMILGGLPEPFHIEINNWVSLFMIGMILLVGVLASISAGKRDTARLESPVANEDFSDKDDFPSTDGFKAV